MKDENGGHHEMRMRMWKMREELLNSMGEKELRAFIKGYMMGQHMLLRKFRKHGGCGGNGERCGGNCGGNRECKRKEE